MASAIPFYSIQKEDSNEIETSNKCSKYSNNDWCIYCDNKGVVRSFKFNGIMMRNPTIMYQGDKSAVVRYSSDKDVVAVKYFNDDEEYIKERRMSILIYHLSYLDSKNDYALVPSYFNNECRKIFMHYKEGNLLELPSSGWDKIKIFKDTLYSITKLAEVGLYYTDLKPENILFSSTNNRTYFDAKTEPTSI